MTPLVPILDAGAGLAAVAALTLAAFPETAWVQPWVKALPAVLWALTFVVAKTSGWRWGVTALTFAALGDFFLAQNVIYLGAGAFAAMQILYSFRLWEAAVHRPRPRRGLLAVPLVYLAATATVMTLVWPRLGGLAVPMASYAALLTIMASGAGVAGFGGGLALGGLLFYLSDGLILVFQVWPGPDPWSTWAVLVPYYLGQALIVRGLRNPRV